MNLLRGYVFTSLLGVALISLPAAPSGLASQTGPAPALSQSASPQMVAQKQPDSSGRYRWLFKKEKEAPTQETERLPLLENLDQEIKQARRIYLSGEVENAILKYRSLVDHLESALNDVPPGHAILTEFSERLQIFDELTAKVLGPLHLEPPKNAVGQVFHLNEKRRICQRNLILKKAEIQGFFDVPERLRQEEARILGDLITVRLEPSESPMRKKQDELRAALDEVRSSLQKRASRHMLMRRGLAMSLAEVQKDLLGPNEILLDFSLFRDRMAVGYITREDAVYHQVAANRAEIARGVFHLQEKLQESSLGKSSSFMGHAWKEPCRRMYRAIFGQLPALPSEKTTVFVIPDGPLWYLPFSILLDPEDRPLGRDRLISLIPSVDMLRFARTVAKSDNPEGPSAGLLALESIPWISDEDMRQGSPRKSKGQKKVENLSEGERIQRLILASPVYPKPSNILIKLQKLFKKFEVWVGATATADRLVDRKGAPPEVTLLAVPAAVTDKVEEETQPALFFSADKGGNRTVYARDFFRMPLKSQLAVLPTAWFDLGDRETVLAEGPVLLLTSLIYAGIPTALINYARPDWGEDDPFLAAVLKGTAEGTPPRRALAEYSRQMPAGLDTSFAGKPPAWAGWILMGDTR
ncbi:MAG: CHAT domain-containing protein [Thermodesulfobacteriota bacterium]